MGDDQDRPGELLEVAAQLGAHIQAGPGVQRGQRLVQEQEAWIGGRGSRGPSSLTTGDLVGAPGWPVGQGRTFQPRPGRLTGQPAAGPLTRGA